MSKSPQLIYLEWEDAIANSRWFGKDSAVAWGKENFAKIKEVGWLVYEDKEFLTLASRWDNSVNDEEQFGGLQKVPKTWIRKRKVLKV